MATAANLLEGETVILSSDRGILSVTNARVIYDDQSSGRSRYVSIMHQSVASCGLVTNSYPLFLFFGGLAALAGFATEDDPRVWSFVAALVLVVLYFVTRSAVLKISSMGGESIIVPTKGMGRDSMLNFLNAVDAQRYRPPTATR